MAVILSKWPDEVWYDIDHSSLVKVQEAHYQLKGERTEERLDLDDMDRYLIQEEKAKRKGK